MYTSLLYLNIPYIEEIKNSVFYRYFHLRTTPKDNHILDIRLDAGRNLYNACLVEALKQLARMRNSNEWRSARIMNKGKQRTERSIQSKIWSQSCQLESSLKEPSNGFGNSENKDKNNCSYSKYIFFCSTY
jgi:hypothetical protein